jgi:excisionase family DNA binding protein
MNVLRQKVDSVRRKVSALSAAVNDLEKSLNETSPEPIGEKGFLTLYEVADHLGLHYNTVRRYVKEGQLPSKRLGTKYYVDPADLPGFQGDEEEK